MKLAATVLGLLDDPALAGSLVVVAWEHVQIVALARRLLAAHNGTASVPDWDPRDFDGIYVVRINRDGGSSSSGFSRHREGLDGMPAACPGPVAK